MSDFNPSNTYWNHNGKFHAASNELDKLIPMQGSVDMPRKNRALEKYRKATNCYYDLYNNGLGNRVDEFRSVFGIAAIKTRNTLGKRRLLEMTEKQFDVIVEEAAKEQGLEEYLAKEPESA